MKPLISTLLFLLAVPLVQAQSDFDPLENNISLIEDGEKQIRIQVEWIEVAHETLTELMAKDRRTQPEGMLSSNDKLLRDELTELIKKGEAKLFETISVIARSGNRAKAESVLEVTYATEFDTSIDADVKSKKPVKPLPMAFEVRKVGAVLEVDPIIGADNRTIDLNLAPSLSYHAGFESYGKYEQDGATIEIKVPRFHEARNTGQVTILNGEYLMMSAVSARGTTTGESDPSRKLMIFVKADILISGLPIEKK